MAEAVVSAGRLLGRTVETPDGAAHAFLGVPYAGDPGASSRLRRSRPGADGARRWSPDRALRRRRVEARPAA